MNDLIQKILNDQEKAKVMAFIDDEVLSEAIKKILLAGVYYNGTLKAGESPDPTRNFFFGEVSFAMQSGASDELLGQKARATWDAISQIQTAFDIMKTVSVTKDETRSKKENPGR